MMISKNLIQSLLEKATEEANKAGDLWMAEARPQFEVFNSDIFGNNISGPVGYMLDNCGNAYLRFRDKRTLFYKAFKKHGFIRSTDSGVITIVHKYRCRQEHGLHIACMKAAFKVLQDGGVKGIYIWDFID